MFEREIDMKNDNYLFRYLLHVSDFHISDEGPKIDHVNRALSALVKALRDKGIQIDYLIHTGDVIDSIDVFDKVAESNEKYSEYLTVEEPKDGSGNGSRHFDVNSFKSKADLELKKEFDNDVKELVESRFDKAKDTMRDFFSDLNIAPGNVIICAGNHDVLRPFALYSKEGEIEQLTCKQKEDGLWEYNCPTQLSDAFIPFDNFLDSLEVANSRKRFKSKEQVQGSVCRLGSIDVLVLNTNWLSDSGYLPGNACIKHG